MRPGRRPRLDTILAERDLDSVWLLDPVNVAWLIDADTRIDRTQTTGVAAVGYDGTDVTAVAPNNEVNRLRNEELPASVNITAFPWTDGVIETVLSDYVSGEAATDIDIPGYETLEPTAFRMPLMTSDVQRYRKFGEEVATIVERVGRSLAPTDTEHAVATQLQAQFAEANIETPVLLVGGGHRAQQYRHPKPQSESLDRYGLLSITAYWKGLFCSCTRTIAFDPPEWLSSRHHAVCEVEATALEATWRAAATEQTVDSVFESIQSAYDDVGWVDEWTAHHQGGATGYAGREWVVTPSSERLVRTPMGFAYNPTVPGAKSEDTHLVTDEGIECLTTTGDWPTIELSVNGREQSRHGIHVV